MQEIDSKIRVLSVEPFPSHVEGFRVEDILSYLEEIDPWTTDKKSVAS